MLANIDEWWKEAKECHVYLGYNLSYKIIMKFDNKN